MPASPAQQEAPPRPRLARHRDQQRRQRHRRQPDEIEIAGRPGPAAPPRASASEPVQHGRRACACFAYHVRHVGAAHQRAAEDHLEAERQAVIAVAFELLAARRTRPPADCGAWAADTGRWWPRPCPRARRSRSSARTSSSVSPSPTMKPDLVSTLRPVAPRESQHVERLPVIRLRAHAAVEPRHGLHIVIEDVRAGVEHARHGVAGRRRNRASALPRALPAARAAPARTVSAKWRGAAVGQVVAIHAGDHHVAQLHVGGHARHVGGLGRVERACRAWRGLSLWAPSRIRSRACRGCPES